MASACGRSAHSRVRNNCIWQVPEATVVIQIVLLMSLALMVGTLAHSGGRIFVFLNKKVTILIININIFMCLIKVETANTKMYCCKYINVYTPDRLYYILAASFQSTGTYILLSL